MADVAAAVAPAGGNGAAAPAAQQQGGFWQAVPRALLMYFVISALMKYIAPQGGMPSSALSSEGASGDGKEGLITPPPQQKQRPHLNLWQTGTNMEIWLYLTNSETLFIGEKNQTNTVDLFYRHSVKYVEDFPELQKNMSITNQTFPRFFVNETNVWAHAFLTRKGAKPLDGLQDEAHPDVTYRKKPMGLYYRESKNKMKKKLIADEKSSDNVTTLTEKEEESALAAIAGPERKVLLHWVPDLVLRIVDDHTAYPRGGIPPHMMKGMSFDREGNYHPVLMFHDFWVIRETTIIVNTTLDELPLRITIQPMSMMQWQFFAAIDQNFNMHEQMGTLDDNSKDEFKKILIDGNPILLGITMVVSLLHTVFDMLAFKNDISFWRNVESLEGLSVRTIFLNVFCQGVVFLYLLDNETSMMILFSSGVGLAIEVWKIKKACHIEIDRTGRIPMIRLRDKSTYVSKTRVYDRMAFRYLSFILYPMVIGYSIYSVFHDTHRSWYAWVLSTLVGSVYTFGFIMMTPQLFINYKLKSVAHLPWKAMTYKFLNTIIDDLFAFVITMPWLHRLSCFRDDVIFLLILYQRWIYRVDMSRVNEYGQVGDREAFEQARAAQIAASSTDATKTEAIEDAAASTESADKKEDGAAEEHVAKKESEKNAGKKKRKDASEKKTVAT